MRDAVGFGGFGGLLYRPVEGTRNEEVKAFGTEVCLLTEPK